MWWASGNRDEDKFDEPYRLDLSRFPNDHMTFGKGPHTCMGSNLARFEMRVLFETLLPRMASVEQTGEITRVRSNFVNGIKKFPVRIEPPAPRRGRTAPTRTRTTIREHEGDLVVESAELVADDVVALTLVDPHGEALPPWTPGAHVDLIMRDGSGDEIVRQYSLCGDPADSRSIRVGVLKAPGSRGGSTFVHERLRPEGTVRVRGPRNHFPLRASPRYLFIGGGIGITPLLPMIVEAEASGADWHLYYGGRSLSSMAFRDELERYGDKVTLVPQDEAGILDLDAILGDRRAGHPGLRLRSGGAAVGRSSSGAPAGWPTGRAAPGAVRGQGDRGARGRRAVLRARPRFVGGDPHRAAGPVRLRRHPGRRDHRPRLVPRGHLRYLRAGGPRRARSIIATRCCHPTERAASDAMMVCVSRCLSDRLTLDL